MGQNITTRAGPLEIHIFQNSGSTWNKGSHSRSHLPEWGVANMSKAVYDQFETGIWEWGSINFIQARHQDGMHTFRCPSGLFSAQLREGGISMHQRQDQSGMYSPAKHSRGFPCCAYVLFSPVGLKGNLSLREMCYFWGLEQTDVLLATIRAFATGDARKLPHACLEQHARLRWVVALSKGFPPVAQNAFRLMGHILVHTTRRSSLRTIGGVYNKGRLKLHG